MRTQRQADVDLVATVHVGDLRVVNWVRRSGRLKKKLAPAFAFELG
jgi:hypothetical protein